MTQQEHNIPLLNMLNHEVDGMIRWCTPSIHPQVQMVRGIYGNDISVSYHKIGNPSLDTGIFHKAHVLAAKAYKSDHTLFSVNGSTGSNFVVLRALKHQLKNIRLLAQRNIHKSIACAIEDYQIDVTYLQPHYSDDLQIFIPNSIDEIVEGLKTNPEINVLLITNPTYEGISLDLPELISRVRKVNTKVIIFIDEAWGAHFPFSKKMPICAMEAGADICVQSTHKQGSGLQQTSMIHWQGNRIQKKYLLSSYQSLISTSPSFHLLASLDAARYLMQTQGEEIIDKLITNSKLLMNGLGEIPGVKIVTHKDISLIYPQVKIMDLTKILVNIQATGLSGYTIAHHLETKYKVIVEKYEANNILFISTFQNSQYEVDQTVKYFKETIKTLKARNKKHQILNFPKFPDIIQTVEASYTTFNKESTRRTLHDAIGKICAEDIVPYPPGIPLISKGEIIQPEHITYLTALRKYKGLVTVIMEDKKITKILTVK